MTFINESKFLAAPHSSEYIENCDHFIMYYFTRQGNCLLVVKYYSYVLVSNIYVSEKKNASLQL